MSSSTMSLMDIFNTESSLSNMILRDNSARVTVCINNTCSMFNKMTAEDMTKHREEYYKVYILKKIEETIENKMFAILKNPHNIKKYKEPEEYDEDLKKLASHINDSNRDSILEKLVNKYTVYVKDYYYTGYYFMFDILMKEYCAFIKNYMEYEITRDNFGEEDAEIYDSVADDM